MDQKLWIVTHRRPRQRGDRKVRVGRHIVMAPSATDAIRIVRDDDDWGRLGGTFRAEPIDEGPPTFDIGCIFDTPKEGE